MLLTRTEEKILRIGDEITLDRVITEANTLELVNKQLEEFKDLAKSNGNEEVNKVNSRIKRNFDKPRNVQHGCGRCGNPRHVATDTKCPARDKECLKCGLKGHFRQYCRTRQAFKRKIEKEYSHDQKKGVIEREKNEVNQLRDSSNEMAHKEEETEYVFHIDDDVEIDCTIGGVETKMLIDSGCKQNLITKATWETLKKNKVILYNQHPNPNVTFMAYGSTSPLMIKGSFEARIQVGSRYEYSTFYVVCDGTRNLLGKTTAISLGVLKIGLNAEVNQVYMEKFPKFKDVIIHLPIDNSIPPVSQPYRRIPIPLKAKIENKIEELKQRDIIELVVDMCRANEAIIRENHPLPTMDNLLPKMKDAKVFTKLDIKDAFHQIEIHPATRHITTFITSKGLFSRRVRPLGKYVSTIKEFRAPKTTGELQSFLGLVNFVSKWIPNYATVTEPLKTLLRNKNGDRTNIAELWGLEQQQCFESLKEIMTNISSLGYYDVNDRTIVIADASPVALGGVLVQTNSEGDPRIIAYGHKTLTDCERRYCQTEKEALALVWAVEHFHIFLYGKKFELITDHKPLEVIFGTKSKPCARIERWVMRLQSYDHKVVYQPGKLISQIHCPDLVKMQKNPIQLKDNHICQIVDFARPRAVSLKEIIESSMNDQEILNVKEDAAHEGHPGIVSMKARLRTKVWWPRCDKSAENIVKACKGCTLVCAPCSPTPMKRRELPAGPWIDIAIDLMGPFKW
ncbi:Retrovirus-related Pol polyprotein from transposon 297 [Eumeta japonica]|uniref:RNA-directed DNA polymerase n=1 Tax=Eumeta variegata TaxID=151549 RepID=A0A4C1Z709_EUMVA|nr:Retrovirus-related Pol polyprotein from transposon 297 [Eumeta japonica]